MIAIKKDMDSMRSNQGRKLIDLRRWSNIIENKLVLKNKHKTY